MRIRGGRFLRYAFETGEIEGITIRYHWVNLRHERLDSTTVAFREHTGTPDLTTIQTHIENRQGAHQTYRQS